MTKVRLRGPFGSSLFCCNSVVYGDPDGRKKQRTEQRTESSLCPIGDRDKDNTNESSLLKKRMID